MARKRAASKPVETTKTLPPPPIEIDAPLNNDFCIPDEFDSWEEEREFLYATLEKLTRKNKGLQKGIEAVPLTMWDLETTGLHGDFDHIICACFKTLGLPPVTFRIDDYETFDEAPWDDSLLCKDVRDYIEKQHTIFTWNGKRFDWPMLNTRLRAIRPTVVGDTGMTYTPKGWAGAFEPPIRGVLHSDVMYVARYQLHLHSASLKSVQNFLGVEHQKTEIKPEVWRMAKYGVRPAMDEVVEHCVLDVEVLEEVFTALSDLVNVVFKAR